MGFHEVTFYIFRNIIHNTITIIILLCTIRTLCVIFMAESTRNFFTRNLSGISFFFVAFLLLVHIIHNRSPIHNATAIFLGSCGMPQPERTANLSLATSPPFSNSTTSYTWRVHYIGMMTVLSPNICWYRVHAVYVTIFDFTHRNTHTHRRYVQVRVAAALYMIDKIILAIIIHPRSKNKPRLSK